MHHPILMIISVSLVFLLMIAIMVSSFYVILITEIKNELAKFKEEIHNSISKIKSEPEKIAEEIKKIL